MIPLGQLETAVKLTGLHGSYVTGPHTTTDSWPNPGIPGSFGRQTTGTHCAQNSSREVSLHTGN